MTRTGWFLLTLGVALMLSTWLGAAHVFVGNVSLGGITLLAGAALCLAAPVFYGHGWHSILIGIAAVLFGFPGFAWLVNAVVAIA